MKRKPFIKSELKLQMWFLGSLVSLVIHEEILVRCNRWIKDHQKGYSIIVANTHVLVEGRRNPAMRSAIDSASLVIPDGMPLVVAARWKGFPLRARADGPGLMSKALSEEPYKHWRHFCLGSTPEVLDALHVRYPDVNFVGFLSPPFRALAEAEDKAIVREIDQAKPDVLWVGLGCPKQELWMAEHKDRLHVPVMVGVGQAFELLAGVKSRAPAWMQNSGLEWLYRLMQEPRRLWRRYLVSNTLFFYYLAADALAGLVKPRA
ncbi:MAG TPA: glycosyltransferase [Candidatus Atribacteria bacterium]|nr:glycosyltransferase [Candidatus Atribacteria bacterium]